jgi:two-component system chemotaxis sensor kinase CheA
MDLLQGPHFPPVMPPDKNTDKTPMDDLLNEFLTETAESIEIVDVELVKLEQDPANKPVLDNIFRIVHTIKGTCGFLGLPRLEKVAHASENILGKFRDGKMVPDAAAVTLVLEAFDRIKDILLALETDQQEPAGDDAELIKRLNDLAEGRSAAPAKAEAAPLAGMTLPETEGGLSAEALAALEAVWNATEAEIPVPAATLPAKESASDSAKAETEKGAHRESALAAQGIRVSVDLLENLMTMVSELVLTRNQLMQLVRRVGDTEFSVPLQRLNHCTTELQEGVMKTRMQPIGNAWSKLPRIVRDLSHELGKKIEIVMKGEETELDRQVLELIRDPLTHMVRNSADHGIESPEKRRAAGKRESGTIELNAYHEGGYILIEIRDDGQGLNVARIRDKVVANGLAGESEAAGMTDQQIQKFIFHPGLSTAEKVTSVSGRGVGMDVVRSNIEKIGGTIELNSAFGKGTTFTIKIPLTLAIVSALIVGCGEDRFAIPQLSVLELVRTAEQSEHRIETIDGTPVLRLRDRLLPLVHLDRLLKTGSADASRGQEKFIVVAQTGDYSFGIVVDEVFDTEEIVVKPVSPLLRDLSYYSGNTILGDGSVIMILDPNGVASATTQTVTDSHASDKDDLAAEEKERTTMLLFKAGGKAPKAVPLALVARLEELDVATIEHAAGRDVIQYRGQLMPLLKANDNFHYREKGTQPIIVFADDDRNMGLAVDEIIDIVEEHVEVELTRNNPGIIGTSVIAGKASELLDVGHYIHHAFANHARRKGEESRGNGMGRSLLVVDDSPFFRNMLEPLLKAAGYDVTLAESPAEALALRDAGHKFDLIVSDIDMPEMDGFRFAESVRADAFWQGIPILALSGNADPESVEKGRRSGFVDHVAKFDQDGLLNALATIMNTRGEAA